MVPPGFDNPYADPPREPSPGEVEVRRGSLLLMAFRYFGVAMPRGRPDEAAVGRTGQLLQRWLRRRAPALEKFLRHLAGV